MSIRLQHSLLQVQLETATMGGQQRPPCQQLQPVNRRKRRIGRKRMGLQREPWGSALDPGNRVFKLEKAVVLNTCGMFGITGTGESDGVNKNCPAIWGYRKWLPLWTRFELSSHKTGRG